jgi:hypothetical protein
MLYAELATISRLRQNGERLRYSAKINQGWRAWVPYARSAGDDGMPDIVLSAP